MMILKEPSDISRRALFVLSTQFIQTVLIQ
jgi:hypothetical protein